jgi:hypothetical protein
VASESLLQQAKSLELQVGGILSNYDIADMPQSERELVTTLKNQLIDARLDAQDYEYAETRVDQLKVAKAAKKRLEQLQETIVKASEYNLFSAVDIAQLSARIQQIISGME